MRTPSTELGRRARQLKLHIAIDGPAGAGKSTVGRGLADALECAYLDTGLMYRAVTLRALDLTVPLSDGPALVCVAQGIEFALGPNLEMGLSVDGRITGPELHQPAVDAAVSAVSAHAGVRTVLVALQQRFAADRAIVMVGRDIGTVVLPAAPVKLWITASVEERARRRGAERAGVATPHPEAVERLHARDRIDSSRTVSPLRPADDVVVLDTSHRDAAEVLDDALNAIRAAVNALGR